MQSRIAFRGDRLFPAQKRDFALEGDSFSGGLDRLFGVFFERDAAQPFQIESVTQSAIASHPKPLRTTTGSGSVKSRIVDT